MNETKDRYGHPLNVGDEVVRLAAYQYEKWPFGAQTVEIVLIKDGYIVVYGDPRSWLSEWFVRTSGVEDEWGPGVCQALVDAADEKPEKLASELMGYIPYRPVFNDYLRLAKRLMAEGVETL